MKRGKKSGDLRFAVKSRSSIESAVLIGPRQKQSRARASERHQQLKSKMKIIRERRARLGADAKGVAARPFQPLSSSAAISSL